MTEDQEIEEMMIALFEDLGLEGASDSEVEDLIAIHGQALGGCALEFQRDLAKQSIHPQVPEIYGVLDTIRTSAFESPVSGKALIHELITSVSAESLRYLLLAAHLAVRAAGVRAREKQVTLMDALDDIVVTIGQKATNAWEPAAEDSQEEWCRSLFVAAQSTAEMAAGEAFFRDE